MPHCFAHGCKHQTGKHTCSQFRFPMNDKTRTEWIKFCRRSDQEYQEKSHRLCSCHFKEGEKANGPSIFYYTVEASKDNSAMRRNMTSGSIVIDDSWVPSSQLSRDLFHDHRYSHHIKSQAIFQSDVSDMAKHGKMPRPDPPLRNELELLMECEEEELTSSQREANYRAHTDYKSALKKIEEAKTVSIPRSGSACKSLTGASLSKMKVKKREIDDVIVIEDDPVITSRSPGKRGRPSSQLGALARSTYQNLVIQTSPSLIQTVASATSSLSIVSSNMSHLSVAPRASSGMIFPSNTSSFLTLPTTLQSNSIGLTMGKKVLLAVPVSATGKQTFMLPTGIKQLQVINAMQSVNSITTAPSAKVSEPVILVTSEPNSTQTISVSAKPASITASPALQYSSISKPRVGRPRKVRAPSPDDDVQVVEPLQVLQPTRVGRPIKKAKRRHYGSNNAVICLDSTVSPAVTVPAGKTVVNSLKPKGRVGRPRKIIAPPSDDEVQIVEPIAVQPVKVVKPESKPPAPIAPAVVSDTCGLGIKKSTTSDEDALSSEIVQQKKHRTASVGYRRQSRNTEASETRTVVSGTYGFGVKRPNVSDEDTKSSESVQKKPKMTSAGRKRQSRNAEASKVGIRKKQDTTAVECEETSNTWIPLDEYYYGKKEGDPTYREDKGEYRFKCWYCHKMLYNNLRLMLHMQGHIDNDKQQNLDLSDLTQCKHCYKQFDTPFEMQCHIEKVHQNNSNVLVCRICEKDHENQSLLQQHMKGFHQACEMPYSCKLCNYRSSIYSDVVDHFKKRHDSSQYILCLYCLKIFKVSFYKTAGWGMTQNYYQHIQKHQNKGNNKKCVCCKLTFLTKQETDDHRTKDHMPNYRGIQSGSSSKKTVNRDKEQVLICVPEAPSVKLLNAPTTSKVLEIRVLHFEGVKKRHRCLECKKPMNTPYHYKNYVECTLCRFATSCNDAFSSHMMFGHSGMESDVKTVSRKEVKMVKEMFCLCGFSTSFGSFMANHLVLCSKRTCYSSQPEMKYFEYDDEQEEFTPFEPYIEESEILRQESSSPDADVPSLFGVLGLVKKPRRYGQRHSKLSGPRSRPEATADAVVNGVIEGILDSIFPAESAASQVISYLLDQVDKAVKPRGGRTRKKSQSFTAVPSVSMDSVPPELTGVQKWKTVRIADANMPSKKSIFLGSEALLYSATSDSRENKSVDAEMPSNDVSLDDVPVVEPVEPEMEFVISTKVSPRVCNEKYDIFWNMPDIEKMELSAEVENKIALGKNEMKDACWLDQKSDMKQPEDTGGMEETKSHDKIKIEKGDASDPLIHLVNKSEEVQLVDEAKNINHEVNERIEDIQLVDGAKNINDAVNEHIEDIQLVDGAKNINDAVNEHTEDVQLVDGAMDVNHEVNEHIDPDEIIDLGNGKDVEDYQQPGLNSSVQDLLGDAVVIESDITTHDDVVDNEEYEYKTSSEADGEESYERGKEISVEFSTSNGLDAADPYKVDSIVGEAAMSASPAAVVSGSLLSTRSTEDNGGKTKVASVNDVDVETPRMESSTEFAVGVHNIEERHREIVPERLRFSQEHDSEKEDHKTYEDSHNDFSNFDLQHDNVVGKKCYTEQEGHNFKPVQDGCDTDQEDIGNDRQEKCSYSDTEQETCNDDQDHVIENDAYRNTEKENHSTDQDDQNFEHDTTGVVTSDSNDQEHRTDKDVDQNNSSLDQYAYVGREDFKYQRTEEKTNPVKEGCFVDNQENCCIDKDLAFDPCSNVDMQDIVLHNDTTLTSNQSKTASVDFENLFSDTDESNMLVPQLTKKESLGVDLIEKWFDTPNSVSLHENDSQLSVKTLKELQKCGRTEEACRSEKSEILDAHPQDRKAQDHSSSGGSGDRRSKGDSSCTDRKNSHSPQTSFPRSPPVSGSYKMNRRDSHHADSSHHKNHGYGSRDDDRRSHNWKDNSHRDSERRDYDRRGYDQRDCYRRDYDRRDYDRIDLDRRDSDRRYYGRNDQGQYDRSGSGYRHETHSYGNQRERDDRYEDRHERYNDSRSGKSRNSGYSKSHDSSDSNRRSHYPH